MPREAVRGGLAAPLGVVWRLRKGEPLAHGGTFVKRRGTGLGVCEQGSLRSLCAFSASAP